MRRAIYSILSTVSAAVLILSFHASLSSGAAGATAGGDASSAGRSSATQGSGSGASTSKGQSDAGASSSPPASSPSATSLPSLPAGGATRASSDLKSGTFTGQSVDTPYGPVQVQIVITRGTISSSHAIVHPDKGGHDIQINSYAIPILDSEVVEAQSGQINMVSGATYTSGGYQASLQSALDQAAS